MDMGRFAARWNTRATKKESSRCYASFVTEAAMSRSYRKWAVKTIPYHPMDRRSSRFYKRQAAKRFRRFERLHPELNLDGAVYRRVYNSWMIKEFRWLPLGRWVKRSKGHLPAQYKHWVK